MVHACIGAMSAAFLPDSAIERLYAPGTENRFSGQGTPTGMLKKVDGGYLLNGKWSYASGIYHATHTHTAALVDDGTGHPAKDANGDVIVLCAHAEVGNHELLGNWNVLGLRATGSIDYGAKDVFIPDDMVFPILTAEPQRQKEFFSLGVVGLAAIGHCGWAIGASRRMLDEIAGFARAKTGRAGLLGESDKFWFDYGRAEARVRAARAFLFEVWRDVEASHRGGQSRPDAADQPDPSRQVGSARGRRRCVPVRLPGGGRRLAAQRRDAAGLSRDADGLQPLHDQCQHRRRRRPRDRRGVEPAGLAVLRPRR